MGCGSSQDAYVRDRRAYHGVAMVAVVSPLSPAGNDFNASATAPNMHAWEAHGNTTGHKSGGGAAGGGEDFYFGVNEALQRRMRRQRIAEWRKTTLGIVREKQQGPPQKPRYDHLTKFGSCQLGMVDELSACTRAEAEATAATAAMTATTMSDGATRSGDRSLPSSLSTSGCTTFVNYASIRLDGSSPRSLPHPWMAGAVLNVSTGPQSSAGPQASVLSMASSPSSSSPSSAVRRPLRLREYDVKPCRNGHAHRVRLVLLVPQGDMILSCSTVDRHLTAYHLHLAAEVGRMVGHDDVILGGALRRYGRLVATASRDCSVILWELPSCQQRRSLPHPAAVHACRFSAAGGEVATVCADGLCRVWTWSDTDVVHTLVSLATGFDGPLTSLAYTGGDRHLVAGGAGGAVFVWDRQRFTEAARVFRQHRSAVLSVDAAPSQAGVVASADERSVYVWDCATLAVLHCIQVESWCSPRRRSPRAKAPSSTGAEDASAAAPVNFYWTTARLVDTFFGIYVVAAGSDKCAHLFRIPDHNNNRNYITSVQSDSGSPPNDSKQGGADDTATLANAGVSEVLSLPLTSSLSCVDGGPLGLIAFGDTCGNRHILTLL